MNFLSVYNHKLYSLLEQLILKAAKGELFDEELVSVLKEFQGDFDETDLTSQLQTFSANFPKEEPITFSSIVQYLPQLSPGMKGLLCQVIRLSKLILVSAATNATSERSFSAMRRAKSYLQSTMGQTRLNNIMILHVHKDQTDELDLIQVANEFVKNNDTRK